MRMHTNRHAGPSPRRWAALAAAIAIPSSVHAQSQPTPGPPSIPLTPVAAASLSTPGAGITYQYGIEFVTIPGSTLNNAPWQGNGTEGDLSVGRGHVGYDYRIARFEVTWADWVAFGNARNGSHNTPVPGTERLTVGGMSWRTAAMYCNWLHNGCSNNPNSLLSGAYDVSTFGYNGTTFTDQIAHSPGARFWIPTLDELILAQHYDPNRNGPGQAGWWLWNIASDTHPAYGPPNVRVRMTGSPGPDPSGPFSQANAGWGDSSFPGYSPNNISLGAYAGVQSPWGLLDTAGGRSEWTEEVGYVNGLFPVFRYYHGSALGTYGEPSLDFIGYFGGEYPSYGFAEFGLRIAAAIPAPSMCMPLLCFSLGATLRRPVRAPR